MSEDRLLRVHGRVLFSSALSPLCLLFIASLATSNQYNVTVDDLAFLGI